jgi:hypothetical protein
MTISNASWPEKSEQRHIVIIAELLRRVLMPTPPVPSACMSVNTWTARL